jgi:hypothetical protein
MVIHFCYLEVRKAYIVIPAFDYYCMIDGIFYVKIEINYMNIGLENDRTLLCTDYCRRILSRTLVWKSNQIEFVQW